MRIEIRGLTHALIVPIHEKLIQLFLKGNILCHTSILYVLCFERNPSSDEKNIFLNRIITRSRNIVSWYVICSSYFQTFLHLFAMDRVAFLMSLLILLICTFNRFQHLIEFHQLIINVRSTCSKTLLISMVQPMEEKTP